MKLNKQMNGKSIARVLLWDTDLINEKLREARNAQIGIKYEGENYLITIDSKKFRKVKYTEVERKI